jgi:ABC-type lipoprotein release transport system permease subunit
MISLLNALKISRNKLHHKKVLIYIAIIISTISVSGLIFITTISNGFLNSIKEYIKQSLNNEYLVKITPNIPSEISWLPRYELTEKQVKDIQTFEKNKAGESILIADKNDTEKTKTGYIVNYDSPLYHDFIDYQKTNYIKTAKNTFSALKEEKDNLSIANMYNYFSSNFNEKTLHFIGEDKNKENLLEVKNDNNYIYGSYDHDIRKSNYTFIEDKIVSTFISEDIKRESDAIPVLTTREESSLLFNTDDILGKSYYACYRKDITDIKECENKNILKFQIIGIIPLQTQSNNSASNFDELFNDIINAKLYSGALIPINMFKESESFNKYGDIFYTKNINNDIFLKNEVTTHIISFKSIDDAKDFLNNKSCKIYSDNCEKNWYSEVFGLNFLLISDISSKASSFTLLISIIAAIIVCLMIFLATIKMIMESKKESAIFRAIGAKKKDILIIYLSYIFIITSRVVILSIIISLTALLITNNVVSNNITTSLIESGFNNYSFSLMAFSPSIILYIIIGVYIISLFATIPVSVINIQQNIIANIKDE